MSSTIEAPTRIEYDLDNGLHVILHPDSFAPVVAFQMWVRVGSADEAPHEAGLAHVMEHMLFKGTATRAVGEIARDIEGAGGDVNAWTSHDETVFHLALPAAEFRTGLEILADAIQNSALDEGELANELEVIREEIKRGDDSPQRRLSEETFRLAFTEHPYRLPVIGTDESVRSFTRDTVLAFYRRWYVPNNMTLVLVGDFSPEAARTHIDELFGSAVGGPAIVHPLPDEPEPLSPRASTLQDETKQSHISLTFLAPRITDPLIPALDVIGVILGQGDSSRLIRLLQRERTLVNDVFAYPYSGRSAGLFMLEVDLPHEHGEEVLRIMARELFRLTREPVGAQELEKAKTIAENEAVYQMQTMQGKARHWGFSHTLTGNSDFLRTYMDAVRRISATDLMDAAARIFQPARACIAQLVDNQSTPLSDERLIELVQEGYREATRPRITATPDAHGIVCTRLSNGVRLIVKENHSVPLVSMQAGWLGGLRFETPETNGINNLIGRMLTQGTGRRSAEAIAEAIDGMAGRISGFSGRNTLGLKGASISRHFEQVFELFADCLLDPAFDDEELAKEKILVSEEIRVRDENPSRVAFDLFQRTLYTSHPFRMDVLGTQESVAALDAEALREYYGRLCAPDGLVLCVVGDISTGRVIEDAERLFGHMDAPVSAFAPPSPDPAPAGVIRAFEPLKRRQMHIVLGFQGLTFADPDRYALDVLNAMLSGQGGRLFMELRDRRSLAYSVGCFHLESVDPGYLALYIGTSPEKREQALEGMLSELARLRDGGVDPEEVAHARRYLIGSHAIGLQTNGSQSGQMLLNEIYDLGYDAHLRYAAQIEAVSCEDVQAVIRRVVTLENYVLAEVGPETGEDVTNE